MQLQHTSASSSSPANTAPAVLQFLRFTTGSHSCATRIDDVREILELTHITPVPLMPAFVRGVMNLRGAVVPVVDLSERLGLGPAEIGRRSCVIVASLDDARGSRRLIGMLVDSVQEVFTCSEDALEPVPRLGTVIGAGFIHSMVRANGETMVALALEAVLGEQALAELIGASLRH